MDKPCISLLQSQIQNEFDCAADYIWKAPGLIDHETELEKKKLKQYFSEPSRLAELRWRHELLKLEGTFPYMIAVGNLFSVASLYETYLLYIVRMIDVDDKWSTVTGQGVSRIHSFFKLLGIDYSGLSTYAAVAAAISIRNCLVHCSGVLAWSREATKLHCLIDSGRFLSQDDRARRIKLGSEFHEVRIVQSFLGARVQIENTYAHNACCYFRDHLLLLVASAATVPNTKGELTTP